RRRHTRSKRDWSSDVCSSDLKKIIGVDISSGMLEVAQEKIEKRNLQDRFEVQLGDSEHLPFQQNTFDAVTVAFGVRNFENLSARSEERRVGRECRSRAERRDS